MEQQDLENLLLQLKDLQSLKPRPHHVVKHCYGITTKKLDLLFNEVLEIEYYFH